VRNILKDVLLAGAQEKGGDRVAQMRRKVGSLRVDVHADPDDHEINQCTGCSRFRKDTGNLTSRHENVVGPFDLSLVCPFFFDRLSRSHRSEHAQEGRMSWIEVRPEDQRQREVLPLGGKPRPPESPPAVSLTQRHNRKAFRFTAAGKISRQILGRARFLMNDQPEVHGPVRMREDNGNRSDVRASYDEPLCSGPICRHD